jgi:hypothetical protein
VAGWAECGTNVKVGEEVVGELRLFVQDPEPSSALFAMRARVLSLELLSPTNNGMDREDCIEPLRVRLVPFSIPSGLHS